MATICVPGRRIAHIGIACAVLGVLAQPLYADRTFIHPAEDNRTEYLTLSSGSYTFTVDANPNGYHWVQWYNTYSGGSPVAEAHLYYYDNESFSFSAGNTYWVRAEVYKSDFWGNWLGWEAAYRWNVTCASPASLQKSTSSLDFDSSSTSKSFSVRNSGGGTLSYSLSDNRSWLSLSPTSGSSTGEWDVINVYVSRSGLSPGSYPGTISISSNGGSDSISVSMTVPDPDPIAYRHSPTSSSITLDYGTNQSFTVRGEDDGGDLDRVEWTLSGPESYSDTDSVLFGGSSDTADFTDWGGYTFDTEGDYTLRARVYDDSGDYDDATWSIHVNDPPKPDLEVTSMEINGSTASDQHFDPGESVRLDFQGHNDGDAPSKTSIRMKWWYGTSAYSKTYEIYYGYLGIFNGLAPDEYEWETDASWPVPTTPGTYWLTVKIDDDNQQTDEEDEGNNERTLRFIVDQPRSGNILSADPDTFSGGQTRTVTVVVKNTGRDDNNLIVECDSKPAGWSVSPGSKQTNVPYNTTNSTFFTFSVTAPSYDSSGTIVWKLYYDDTWPTPNTLLDTYSQTVSSTPQASISEAVLDRVPAKTSQTGFARAASEMWNPGNISATVSHQGVHVLVTVTNDTGWEFEGRLSQGKLIAPDGSEVTYPVLEGGHGTTLVLGPHESQSFVFPVFQKYSLLGDPPAAGTWQVCVDLAEGLLSGLVIQSIRLPLEVIDDAHDTAGGPPPAYGDIIYYAPAITWTQLAYNILDMLVTMQTGSSLNVTYFDYINAQGEAFQAILGTGEVSLRDNGLVGGNRSLTVSWRNGTSVGEAFVYYDRCIITVLLPPGMRAVDSAGGTTASDKDGNTAITWSVTRTDKRIKPGEGGEYTFSVEEPENEAEVKAGVALLVGPFQGEPGGSYTALSTFPLIYNWSKWNADPASVHWCVFGSGAVSKSLAGTSKGTINVAVSGVSPGNINASILYRSNYVEVQRKDADLGTAPSGTTYSFDNVLYGPDYVVDVYCWDMWVGETGPFALASPSVSRTIVANSKRPLTVRVFYSDGATSFPSATVKLYSWDGHRSEEHVRAVATTGSDGRVIFAAWPTTKPGERYILRVYNGAAQVWEKLDAALANTTSGSSYNAVTSVPPPLYALTLAVKPFGGGSISASPSGVSLPSVPEVVCWGYSYGQVVQLTAVASPGWHFDHWSGDLSGTQNPKSITMNGDKSVTAYFAEDNVPPSVSITEPVNGAILAVGSNVTIRATASDTDGVVTKVEFYRDGIKLGEDTSSLYETTWNSVPLGHHTLTAMATDNDGATKVSDPVTIEVRTPGDANGDGKVDSADLATLLYNWNPLGTGASWEEGDFNGDGKVDSTDLAILLGHWDPVGKTVVAAAEVQHGSGDSPRLIATYPVLGSRTADLKTLSLTFDRPVEVGASVAEVYGGATAPIRTTRRTTTRRRTHYGLCGRRRCHPTSMTCASLRMPSSGRMAGPNWTVKSAIQPIPGACHRVTARRAATRGWNSRSNSGSRIRLTSRKFVLYYSMRTRGRR